MDNWCLLIDACGTAGLNEMEGTNSEMLDYEKLSRYSSRVLVQTVYPCIPKVHKVKM